MRPGNTFNDTPCHLLLVVAILTDGAKAADVVPP